MIFFFIDNEGNACYCMSVPITLVQLEVMVLFIIDTRSSVPIFEQIKKQILEFISIGILSANDKLPSVRSLASDLGINPNTVAKAYQELEDHGYLYSIKGKGCFIADNESEKLIKVEKLKEFKKMVQDMKQHHIEQEQLLVIIHSIYEEGKPHA